MNESDENQSLKMNKKYHNETLWGLNIDDNEQGCRIIN